MKLALITYDAPHLKTAQVALNLAERRDVELRFFGLPYRVRKARDALFEHRPNQARGPATRVLAHVLGAPFHPVKTADEIPIEGVDYFLITGAPLLPASFVARSIKVINAHPGVIPLSRGLDSFKWSIMDGLPLGNSLHFIDSQADAGEVIGIRPTPVFESDNLECLAARHYELEIDMLSNFDRYITAPGASVDMSSSRPVRMRMPREVEQGLQAAFLAYRDKFTAA